MARENPGIHSIQLGEITVTALNDGMFEAATALVLGLAAAETESMLRDSFRHVPPRIGVSCFLLETPERRVMVDAGAGGLYGAALGRAAARLAALGVSPDAIDTVLLTHCHPDHLGGTIDSKGKAVFTSAALVVGDTEAAFWSSEENRARAPEASRGAFDTARTVFAAYGERTRRIADGAEALPGITIRLLPGHTPGHSGFHITSGSQSLLIWGDLINLPGIQFARPDAGVTFDADAKQAAATRTRALDQAAADRVMVAGIHHDFPVFGHVLRRGGGFAFEPEVWTPSAAGLLA